MMKKLVKLVSVLAACFMLIGTVSAQERKVVEATQSFKSVFQTLTTDSFYQVPNRSEYYPYFFLKDSTKARGYLKSEMEYNLIKPLQMERYIELYVPYYVRFIQMNSWQDPVKGNCTSFVEAAVGKTFDNVWRGEQVTPKSKIAFGTAIITSHQGNGQGHTAIFLKMGSVQIKDAHGRRFKKHFMWVIDQSNTYYLKSKDDFAYKTGGKKLDQVEGVVGVTRIYFDDPKAKRKSTMNAYSYYTFYSEKKGKQK
jgi:hypothetical protein